MKIWQPQPVADGAKFISSDNLWQTDNTSCAAIPRKPRYQVKKARRMAQSFPVRSFYSKNSSKRSLELEEKLERTESELKKKPLPPDLRSSLLGHSVDWKVFAKLVSKCRKPHVMKHWIHWPTFQDDALKYAGEARSGLGLMTFAFEEKVPGSEGRYC